MAINKVEFGNNVLLDLSSDTLTSADQIRNGYVGHLRDGTQVTGTYQGGGTDGYTLTNIVPSQTITATTTVENAYMIQIPTYTDVLELGKAYLVNYDGDDYVLWCYEGWSQEYLIGDNQIVDSTYIGRLTSPFTIDYGVVDDELVFISRDTNAHTIKVDKIMFIDPTATLVSKTITQNGTYNASSDNADGYSSVEVNVSGGSSEQIARGSVTFTSTYSSTGNRLVCALSDIGFTPKRFYMNIKDRDTVSGISSVMLRTSYEVDNGGNYLRVTTRFTNTSGSLGSAQNGTNWTTQSSYTLYNNGTNIYFRTTSAYTIQANTTYEWLAIG